MHIDHTTLRTRDLDKTKNFMVAIFDLEVGERPAAIAAKIPGYWLYWKESPLVHLIQSNYFHQQGQDNSAEAIDHTAFYMDNYDEFKDKLMRMNVPMSLMNLPDIGERRIFIHTPTGILLETVFRE